MISILIPVYNQHVLPLLEQLNNQAIPEQAEYEIIVMDDGSAPDWKERNAACRSMERVRYIELPANTGRSSIRNRLAGEAVFPFLLFLDGDSLIPGDDFLGMYLREARESEVLCGGRIYPPPATTGSSFSLHTKYGIRRESKAPAVRARAPHRSFMTHNFLVPASVFGTIGFDERIRGYGHEDTLFGYRLMQEGIPVRHLDNPVLHADLQPNHEFLSKSLEAARALPRVWSYTGMDHRFANQVSLLRSARMLRRTGTAGLLRFFLAPIRAKLEKNLLGSKPSLAVLNLLKLEACLGAFRERLQEQETSGVDNPRIA